MEPQLPEPSWIIESASAWWKQIVAFFGAVGAVYAFYRKYLKGKYGKIMAWISAAAAAPLAIVEIKKELEFEAGVSLRQKLIIIGDDLARLGQILSNEIANRRAALQHVETPLYEFDLNGRFVWGNDALLETADCELADVLGNNWRNCIAGPDRPSVLEAWAMAVKDGTDFRTKFRLATDGNEQWVLFSVICNKDSVGNVLGWIGKLRKIADPRIHNTGGQ